MNKNMNLEGKVKISRIDKDTDNKNIIEITSAKGRDYNIGGILAQRRRNRIYLLYSTPFIYILTMHCFSEIFRKKWFIKNHHLTDLSNARSYYFFYFILT